MDGGRRTFFEYLSCFFKFVFFFFSLWSVLQIHHPQREGRKEILEVCSGSHVGPVPSFGPVIQN